MSSSSPPVRLFLASSSPRRRAIMQSLGLDFSALTLAVNEMVLSGEQAEDYVCRVARMKALAGLELADDPQALVLAADTTVVAQGRIMGKPASEAEASSMLQSLSGAWHEVHSAIALATADSIKVRLVTSRVRFRPLSQNEIKAYWDSGEPRDKAGAYAIQGLGAMFVEQIDGSYSAIVGLPILETTQLLASWGMGPEHILREAAQ